MNLSIKLIETDSLDSDNYYYLYEVEGDNLHYYITRSSEDNNDLGEEDYSNKFHMLTRANFTNREWEIAKYLFMFLWDSSNGTNTCVEQDIYEEDGFTREEMEKFLVQFDFGNLGVLDMYSDGGVEIFWDYFSCFDLTKCNPFEDLETESKKTFRVCITTTFTKWVEVEADSEEEAREIVENDDDLIDGATDTTDFETEVTEVELA